MAERTARVAGSLRRRVYLALTGGLSGAGRLTATNKVIILLIIASIGFAIFESEEVVRGPNSWIFQVAETGFALAFAAEYLARLWTCAEEPRYRGFRGRLRFMLTPAALIDLLALAPLVFVAIGSEAFVLRVLQLVRILRLARIGRYSNAANAIRQAVRLRRYELAASLLAGLSLMLVAAAGLYVIEGTDQPDKFGSIPRAMWWSIATLTTVGYGDVYPITVLGRLFASITAVIGIGLIALPAGIVAAAFAEVVVQRREEASEAVISEASAFDRTLSQLIDEQIERASLQGRPHIEINAGDLHRTALLSNVVSADLSLFCAQLRASMGPNDIVVHRSAEGDGPALTIRYLLPRRT